MIVWGLTDDKSHLHEPYFVEFQLAVFPQRKDALAFLRSHPWLEMRVVKMVATFNVIPPKRKK